MKLFHISDLHIGVRLYNRDLFEDQRYILMQIADRAKERKPDAILIAGDIYDKAVPSAEAVGLFDEFVSALSRKAPDTRIMMISGNHDNAQRVNVFRGLLKRQHIHMIGMPPMQPDEWIEQVTMEDAYGPVHFFLLPFVKPSMVKMITGTDENGNNLSYDESMKKLIAREQIIQSDRNVLVSHQFYLPSDKDAKDIERMDSEIKTAGNIDQISSEVLAPFDYAALGHIHKAMKAGSDVYRYCGTPMAVSVSEAGQQKGILEITLGQKGDVGVETIPLKPLREIRLLKGELDEVVKEACDDYVTVVLTDQKDLDIIDMQTRLRHAFPNLLEIRRELIREVDLTVFDPQTKEMSPYELCSAFLKDLNDEEELLLNDIVNCVLEVQ